jgi:hypothetical protein
MLSAHFYWTSADMLTELIALTCVLFDVLCRLVLADCFSSFSSHAPRFPHGCVLQCSHCRLGAPLHCHDDDRVCRDMDIGLSFTHCYPAPRLCNLYSASDLNWHLSRSQQGYSGYNEQYGLQYGYG